MAWRVRSTGDQIADAVKQAKAITAGMNRGKPRHVFLVVAPRQLQLIDVDSETLVQARKYAVQSFNGRRPPTYVK